MDYKALIYDLSELVVLHTSAFDTASLNRGKCGSALCLFEVSALLNNHFFKKKAFDFLCQALVLKNQNADFKYGLAGVGFVLSYVAERKYINACIPELFEKQNDIIRDNVETFINRPYRVEFGYFNVCLYLKYCGFKGMDVLATDLLKIAERMLLSMGESDDRNDNYRFCLDVPSFLLLCQYCGYQPSVENINKIAINLYRKGIIVDISCCLNKICGLTSLGLNYEYSNLIFEMKNVYSLREIVDSLFYLIKCGEISCVESFLNNALGEERRTVENWLNDKTQIEDRFSYESGVVRFILLLCYLQLRKAKDENASKLEPFFIIL